MGELALEPGSFRDREGRVYINTNEIYRGLSQTALTEWRSLQATKFFKKLLDQGKLVNTSEVESSGQTNWAGMLKHEKIPFISYPYEWTFNMLKDAALLTLDLNESAIAEGMILKDSSAFNIQFIGARPVFIDIPSFVKLKPGQPWIAYRQFCQMFLFPLLLQSFKDFDFRTILRGSIDGISAQDFAKLIKFSDLFRPGVFIHGFLQAKMEKSASRQELKVKQSTNKINFKPEFIINNIRGLRSTINKLQWKQDHSTWGDYANDNSYNDSDAQLKKEFVSAAVNSGSWNLAWDLGSNTGVFSRIAASRSKYVLSIDGDTLAVDRNYQRLQKEAEFKNILPLAMNLSDPSPNLGWRGLERKALAERGKPDLVLCLAPIHHMVISANIPLDEFVEWLASLTKNLVIEFVTKDDDMVKILLANKEDIYHDYTQENFENCLNRFYSISKTQTLKNGTRTLYFCTPK